MGYHFIGEEEKDLRHSIIPVIAVVVTLLGTATNSAHGQAGSVLSHQKISATEGGFKGTLDLVDGFGNSVAWLGDLDGDGVGDLAVGARADDDGAIDAGAVWILFLNEDGTVKSHQKISATEGGFHGSLDEVDYFGTSLALLPDLDGDGVNELAVGALYDDDGVDDAGAVWILFLNSDGTVKSHQKISTTEGGFTGILAQSDFFSCTMSALDDMDGDGVSELAVGAPYADDGGGFDRGALWILFLNADGTVKSHQKNSATHGDFTGELDVGDEFGSVAAIGDLDGDGVADLAVGAPQDGDGGVNLGAVWILFLNSDGTVKSHQKISQIEGGFTGKLAGGDFFGGKLVSLGDLDGDGVVDLAVGAVGDDGDGGTARGAVWILFLNSDGTVKSQQKISDTDGGFLGVLDNGDFFGSSVAAIGDHNGDGSIDIAVGAIFDDDGGKPFTDRGAVWVLFLDGGPGNCPWDLDNTGSVGTSDLLMLFAQWGTDGPADFDGSGAVGTSDLIILFANWGPCE